MSAYIVSIFVFGFVLALSLYFASLYARYTENDSPISSGVWDAAFYYEPTSFGKFLLILAKKLSQLRPAVSFVSTIKAGYVEDLLKGAAGVYAANTVLFFLVQTVAFIIASVIVAFSAIFQIQGPFLLNFLILAVMVISFPLVSLRWHAASNYKRVTTALPDFVSLLQLPLSSGTDILSSLKQVVAVSDNLVSREVNLLLNRLETTDDEMREFTTTGRRLGTPEAMQLLTLLGNAHVRSQKVLADLTEYSQRVQEINKDTRLVANRSLPYSLAKIIIVHFVPLLLFVGLPLFVS